MSSPLPYQELRSILNDTTDATALAQEFVNNLSNLFDAIHALTDSKPEAGVNPDCHRISTVRMTSGLAKIGSYLADDWVGALEHAKDRLQERITLLKEEQGVG